VTKLFVNAGGRTHLPIQAKRRRKAQGRLGVWLVHHKPWGSGGVMCGWYFL
jgi:hypothetical protein